MRKREREKVIGRLTQGSEVKHSHSVHVRPYYSDGEKLDEIARETGEVKAAIVRRMIRFALSDTQKTFAANPCREKLDWLIKNGRGESGTSAGSDTSMGEVLERLESLEGRIENVTEILHQLSIFLREIYCLSGVSFSSQNLIFARLLEFASPNAEERQRAGLLAAGALANQIAQAIKDLNKLEAFHKIDSGMDGSHDLYLLTKIKAIRDLIATYSSESSDKRAGSK